MKNGFQRATTSSDRIEDNKRKLKAFRSEIYNNTELRDKKKNAFIKNTEEKKSINGKSPNNGGENRDKLRDR